MRKLITPANLTKSSVIGEPPQMNEYIATIKSAYDEYLEELKKAVDGVSDAEAYSQPSPDSNHIGWLVWHMARVEDYWINGVLRDADQVWNRGGWDDKFGMDSEARGAGQSIDEVKAMPMVKMADLLAYFDAVRSETAPAIESLDEEKLAAEIEHPRFGTITGRWLVGHIIVEESQHTGQVALIRGMMRGFGK